MSYKIDKTLIPFLFKKTDDVLVVVNSYPNGTKKVEYPNFFKRYVKNHKLKYSLCSHEFKWEIDEEHVFVQQMSLFYKVSNLKLAVLFKTLIHEDFPSLRPRLRKSHCQYAPDIFIVNIHTKCIFHLYDDRGCELINTDRKFHEKLLNQFKDWDLQAKN